MLNPKMKVGLDENMNDCRTLDVSSKGFLHHDCCFTKRNDFDASGVQADTFAFRGVVVTINKKKILDDVFGEATAGSMMAVMGPSGAGKTTLFNSLIGMSKMRTGQVFYKDHAYGKLDKRKTAYVLQSDYFYDSLTLSQTLNFYAQVTLPDDFTKQQKQERINDVVEFFELTKCLNTKVGNPFFGGLSGGERKRASIAIALLRDPDIFLLDEPTSGLDSSLAYNITSNLKRWCETRGKIVLATIHQPSSQIFHLFYNLLLIANGQVAYFGPIDSIVPHLTGLDIACPVNWNPADFIVSLVHSGSSHLETLVSSMKPIRDTFAARWSDYKCHGNPCLTESVVDLNKAFDMAELGIEVSLPSSIADEELSEEEFPASYFRQYLALTKRYFVTSKNRILSPVHIFQGLFLSLVMGLIVGGLPSYDINQRDRLALIFVSMLVWSFDSVMDAVRSFPEHRLIVGKERDAHMYRMSAFIMALQTVDMPMILILPFIFFSVVFWSAQLSQGIAFLYGLLVLFLNGLCLQGFGIAIGIALSNPDWAITACLTFMIATMFCGGFFVTYFPVWISWLRYASILNYSYGLMLQVMLPHGANITCSSSLVYLSSPRCLNATSYKPEEDLVDMTYILPMWANIVILIGVCIVFRISSYALLRVCLKPKRYNQ